jgi:predicted negative regulator of RcsB-dependent stress response
MAKKKVSRKELLKSPDEFLTFSERALNFYKSNERLFQYGVLAIAVAAVAYLGINTYIRSVNKKGQAAYNSAYYSLIKQLRGNPKLESVTKSEALFQKVVTDYGQSRASQLALPQVANIKFLNKQYDDAIRLYQEFLEEVSGNIPYESLTRLALTACYEAKGDIKTAIQTLNPILKAPDNPFREIAMWTLARLYRMDNQPTKEKDTLKQFVETFKDSPFLPMAKARL